MGHQLMLRPDTSDELIGYPTWTMSFREGEAIKAMINPHRGQVASIGKVLANRTTLYKYLNPRLFVLVTESSAGPAVLNGPTKGECRVYVVDAAKGTVVYRVAVPAVAGPGETCDVKVSLAENWLVYYYYDDDFSGNGQTKGWRMVSVELYEGKGIDDKTMR
jgi:ER membrane protein complex subunit 1